MSFADLAAFLPCVSVFGKMFLPLILNSVRKVLKCFFLSFCCKLCFQPFRPGFLFIPFFIKGWSKRALPLSDPFVTESSRSIFPDEKCVYNSSLVASPPPHVSPYYFICVVRFPSFSLLAFSRFSFPLDFPPPRTSVFLGVGSYKVFEQMAQYPFLCLSTDLHHFFLPR